MRTTREGAIVPGIKAIETIYKGFRFRSRLEARWAVFFDALGVQWDYEKEGFELGEAGRYLPDFWLPEQRFWIEIKAMYPPADERKKLQAFAWGMPDDEVYLFDRPDFQAPYMSKPDFNFVGAWGRFFSPHAGKDDYEGDCAQAWVQCTECIMEGRPPTFGILFGGFLTKHAIQDHGWSPGEDFIGGGCDDTPTLVQAYQAAKQARFEHGESGAPKRGLGGIPRLWTPPSTPPPAKRPPPDSVPKWTGIEWPLKPMRPYWEDDKGDE